jgi:hypothetical protein
VNFYLDNNRVIVNFNDGVKNDFFIFFNNVYKEIIDKNIIIDFGEKNIFSSSFLNKLLNISISHQNLNLSFVIVSSLLNSESIPESLVCSPTLNEAKDLIEMDEMQRDLGL